MLAKYVSAASPIRLLITAPQLTEEQDRTSCSSVAARTRPTRRSAQRSVKAHRAFYGMSVRFTNTEIAAIKIPGRITERIAHGRRRGRLDPVCRSLGSGGCDVCDSEPAVSGTWRLNATRWNDQRRRPHYRHCVSAAAIAAAAGHLDPPVSFPVPSRSRIWSPRHVNATGRTSRCGDRQCIPALANASPEWFGISVVGARSLGLRRSRVGRHGLHDREAMRVARCGSGFGRSSD